MGLVARDPEQFTMVWSAAAVRASKRAVVADKQFHDLGQWDLPLMDLTDFLVCRNQTDCGRIKLP
jgi:hypothetical protein